MTQKLTEEQVRHVAKLSRLKLTDREVHAMSEKLSAVLDYVSKLQELNVDNVEPMAHAMEMTNALREDKETVPFTNEIAMANAPDKHPPFFKVPKVIDDGGGA